ncbi:hypothetical protein B0H19DRAFT_1264634 [Mycena capillaripes]|nr:hypothetical protein B0H19DRAFT_1264634 [Mycena capillaripes]
MLDLHLAAERALSFEVSASFTALDLQAPEDSDEEEAQAEGPSKAKTSKSKSKPKRSKVRSASHRYQHRRRVGAQSSAEIRYALASTFTLLLTLQVRIDFTDPATFPVKPKVTAAKGPNLKAPAVPAKAIKSIPATAVAKPAKLVPESASESESSDEDTDASDGRTPDVAPSDKEFLTEVPRIVGKKAKSIPVVSDDEEMPDAPPRQTSRAVDELFDDDSDTPDYIYEALKRAAAIKAKTGQVSDDDMAGDDNDLAMHEAIAKALTTIPRSRRASTASWSSDQGLPVPDTDVDDVESDEESDADEPIAQPKVRKVSAARQQKADLEKPHVRPAADVKKEPGTVVATPARPESSWHQSARLSYPAPGKDIRLNDQSEETKLVIRGGIKLLKIALLVENSYPAILSRTGTGKGYLLQSAEDIGADAVHIKERLTVDSKYAAVFADLLIDRVNILRGSVKKVGVNVAPGHYKLSGLTPAKTKERVEELLKDHRYIFPLDPATGRLQTDLPFCNPALIAVLKQGVFTGQFRARVDHLFISTSKKHPERLELPDAMVSLAATALYAALVEYRLTGEHQSINFTEAAYEDTYRNHMKTLADTRTYAPNALHKVLHSLFNSVIETKSVQSSAGSSATLINLVDLPESD